MTDVVIPSRDRTALANGVAAAQFEGAFQRIVPDTERALELPEAGLNSGALGAFDLVSIDGGDPAEITVESGEAFVGGGYLARDTQTTATSSSTAPETFAVGWEHDSPDGVVIQPVSDFADRDRYLKIWEIDANLNSTDLRQFGLATAGATARPETATAIGDGATALAPDSIAIGRNVTVESTANKSIVLGEGIINNQSGLLFTNLTAAFSQSPIVLLPLRDDDPTGIPDGSIWYRTDLDEYRGYENGTYVTFDTTQV